METGCTSINRLYRVCLREIGCTESVGGRALRCFAVFEKSAALQEIGLSSKHSYFEKSAVPRLSVGAPSDASRPPGHPRGGREEALSLIVALVSIILYMYKYTYMYRYMCICVYVYMCVYIYIYREREIIIISYHTMSCNAMS